MPGKTSQTLQFPRESAEQLFRILKEEFEFQLGGGIASIKCRVAQFGQHPRWASVSFLLA